MKIRGLLDRPLALGVTYLVGYLAAAWVLTGLLEQELTAWALGLGLAPALGLPLARRWRSGRRSWTALWIVFGLLCLLNQLLEWVPVQRYGDWRALERYIVDATPQPRWLAGSVILIEIHQLLVRWSELAADRETAGLFLRCAASLVTAFSSVLLLRRWPDRLRIVLPTLTPIWILFAAGHAEYYPFIGALWLFTLAWTLDRPLADRSARSVGLLAALLAIAYFGYLPQAALLLVVFGVASPRKAVAALAWALGSAALAVWILWPDGLVGYLERLHSDLQAEATTGLLFPAYADQVAEPGSILFGWRYALSSGHLWDLLLMQSLGGGLGPPLVALAGLLALARGSKRLRLLPAALLEPHRLFLAATLAWQSYYFLRMLPILGPIQDIDIFFSFYLTVAFTGGYLLDRWARARRPRISGVSCLAIAICLAGSLAALPSLLVTGIRLPTPRWGDAEFAVALKSSRSPEMIREFHRGIEEGRVRIRSLDGGSDAVVAGVHFDRWTYGTRPAVILIRDRADPLATPILRLSCNPPSDASPVVVTVLQGHDPPRELTFSTPGSEIVRLRPLTSAERRVVVLWSDRAWPGHERVPRQLGVRVDAVVLQPTTQPR